MKTISIIGGGNMGAAILGGIKGRYSVIVCEKDATKVKLLQKKLATGESYDSLDPRKSGNVPSPVEKKVNRL